MKTSLKYVAIVTAVVMICAFLGTTIVGAQSVSGTTAGLAHGGHGGHAGRGGHGIIVSPGYLYPITNGTIYPVYPGYEIIQLP